MSLKELTRHNHTTAERKEFASILMSGSIDPYLYYKYLTNQYYIYMCLESKLPLAYLDIEDIRRTDYIDADIKELELEYGYYFEDDLLLPSTIEYIEYCNAKVPLIKDEFAEDSMVLVPHMYVRHFGDMYGGAMIARRVPGKGMMYVFKDKEMLKEKVRAILNDDMSDEANVCFEFAIKLFGELV